MATPTNKTKVGVLVLVVGLVAFLVYSPSAPVAVRGVAGVSEVGCNEAVVDIAASDIPVSFDQDNRVIKAAYGQAPNLQFRTIQNSRVFSVAWPTTSGVVEWSTNLKDWNTNDNVTRTGSNYVWAQEANDQPQKFYRLRLK